MSAPYEAEPPKDVLEKLPGPAVLEFGTNWCGYCKAAQPLIESALAGHANVRHIKVEDGKGRPLGRAYRVTLWPTLIFLRDGVEIARVVRPTDAHAISESLARIA
jgi:thioredoxin 1